MPFFRPFFQPQQPLPPLGRAPGRRHDAAPRAGRVHGGAALPGAAAGVPRHDGVPRFHLRQGRSPPGPTCALRTVALNHPDGAAGYRVEYRRQRRCCYVTDTEHVPGALDRNARSSLMRGRRRGDLRLACTPTTNTRATSAGGTRPGRKACACASAAGAKKLVVFHHDPEHDDELLDGIGARGREGAAGLGDRARGARPGAVNPEPFFAVLDNIESYAADLEAHRRRRRAAARAALEPGLVSPPRRRCRLRHGADRAAAAHRRGRLGPFDALPGARGRRRRPRHRASPPSTPSRAPRITGLAIEFLEMQVQEVPRMSSMSCSPATSCSSIPATR